MCALYELWRLQLCSAVGRGTSMYASLLVGLPTVDRPPQPKHRAPPALVVWTLIASGESVLQASSARGDCNGRGYDDDGEGFGLGHGEEGTWRGKFPPAGGVLAALLFPLIQSLIFAW